MSELSDEMELPERRLPAQQPIVQCRNNPIILAVTVCTKDRKPILARKEAMSLLVDLWQSPAAWLVGDFVLMPDHLHFLCAQGTLDVGFQGWMRYWKSQASRRWPWSEEMPVWQKAHWDRQLRSGESYESKWMYIAQNPVRHGLVDTAEDWPFRGCVHAIGWG